MNPRATHMLDSEKMRIHGLAVKLSIGCTGSDEKSGGADKGLPDYRGSTLTLSKGRVRHQPVHYLLMLFFSTIAFDNTAWAF